MNDVRVNLLKWNEIQIAGADGRLQQLAILQNIFARIPIHETQIQHFISIEHTDTASAGAKSMNEPWQFAEWGKLQKLQTLRKME